MREKLIKAIFYSLVACCAIVIVLLSLEIYFRLNGSYNLNGIQYNDCEVWRWRKNVADPVTNNEEGLKFIVHTDKFGFRNYKKELHKPKDVIRILILGDSYTSGLSYPDDKIFTSLLEKNLANINPAGKKIEVIGASSPGWSTEQELLCLQHEAMQYEPDYVLLMACPNDIREAYCKKFAVLDSNGEVKFNYPGISKSDLLYWKLSTHSSLFIWLEPTFLDIHYGTFEQLTKYFAFNFGKEDGKNWDRPVFLKSSFYELDQARKLFLTLVGKMHDEGNRKRIHFAVSLVPTKIEFDNTMKIDTAMQSGLVSDMLQHYCDSTGIDYVNLYGKFKNDANPTSYFLKSDFHYNGKGHIGTAEGLTEYYKKILKQ